MRHLWSTVPHKPTFDTFAQQPGGSVFQAHSAVLSSFSVRNLGPKRETHLSRPHGTQEDAGRAGSCPGFQIPRPGSRTNPDPPEHPLCAQQRISHCGTRSPTVPHCTLTRPSGDPLDTGVWHLGLTLLDTWLPKRWSGSAGPRAWNPGTEFAEAQRSGLFGARPQAAGERAEEEILLAGFGELGQALLFLLELGADREESQPEGHLLP